MQDMETISAGDSLVVRSYDDKCSYIIDANGEKKINKSRVSLKEIIGQPYGAVFELNNRKFQRVSEQVQAEVELYDAEDPVENEIVTALSEPGRMRGDNSTFVDTNTAQKLSNEDILKLKDSGMSADNIIKTLIQNSDTFAVKTEYAQAKWIKKKENKYRRRYKILRSTPMSLCEASYDKNREKICSMRFESLAQILSQSGIHSGTRVLVMDSVSGLLVGSIAYRMRGKGLILALYGGQQPHLEMSQSFNLTAEELAIIQPVPSTELGPAAQDVCRSGFSYAPATTTTSQQTLTTTAVEIPPTTTTTDTSTIGQKRSVTEEPVLYIEGETRAFGNDTKRPLAIKGTHRTGKTDAERVKVRSYLRQGVDRLIIACKYRPLPILKQALYVLQPSSSFVVFHEFLEPLVDCYLYLQANNLALRLVLSDTWMREFQTLPGRVRPDMFMSTTGGFILSGIYVGQVPCTYTYGTTTGASTSNTTEEKLETVASTTTNPNFEMNLE